MLSKPSPPETINELMQRVSNIAGMTLGELAIASGLLTPTDLQREKGWSGQLIEFALGASAGSKPEPDFQHLGIELKTLPISSQGKPLETTYVSVTPLVNIQGMRWETSTVKKKLNHVLWLPIFAERQIPVSERIIGSGFLWQPSEKENEQLRRDWEEVMELIAIGKIEQLNGKLGEVMQVRPKAAHSKVKTNAIGPNGKIIQTLPRGFYLKTHFTHAILSRQFA